MRHFPFIFQNGWIDFNCSIDSSLSFRQVISPEHENGDVAKNAWCEFGLQIGCKSFLLVLNELFFRHNLEELQHHGIDLDGQFLVPIHKILGIEIGSLGNRFFQLHDIHVKVTFHFDGEIEGEHRDVVFGEICTWFN